MSRKGTSFIVTGGCSGLGYATVVRLVKEGANVLIFDRNEEQGAGNDISSEIYANIQFTFAACLVCVEIIAKLGSTVQFAKVDVTDEENVSGGSWKNKRAT